jgi:excisionase family DNA binding protein
MKLPDLATSIKPSAGLPALGLPDPLAYRIPEVCKLTGLGRTTVYEAIKSGVLIARRYRRCTVVLAEDLTTFLRKLPTTRSDGGASRNK